MSLRMLSALAFSICSSTGCVAESELELDVRASDEIEAEDDDANETTDVARRVAPDAATPRSPEATTVCGQERAPSLVAVEPTLADQYVVAGDDLRIDVDNRHPVPGRAIVSVSVLSERGSQTLPDVVAIPIAAGVGRATTVRVPVAALGLPTDALAVAGHLEIVTRVEYDDGTDTVADASLSLSFHPVVDGWQIYDEFTRLGRYHGGALTARMQRWTAEHPDARIGAAFVHQVSSDTDWNPGPEPLDDHGGHEDDHDHAHAYARSDDRGAAAPDQAGPSGFAETRGPSAFPTVKLCLKQTTTYTDAGHGEDYWTTSAPYPRSVPGVIVEVRRSGALLFAGPLGDGIGVGDPGKGCTPSIGGTGTFAIRAFTYAEVQDNDIIVDGDFGDTVFELPSVVVTTMGTHTVTYSPGTFEANVMAVAAQGLYRHAGGLSNKVFSIHTNAGSSRADPNYSGNTAEIFIATGDSTKKFIIAHELGHAVGGQATGGRLVNNDCSFSSVSCPSAGSHSMTSKENSACAIGEGYAHFYSADIWNNHYEDDCSFEYWGSGTPAIDCENGMLDYPQAYMENECAPTYGGRGVELDWLRQLWDVHTEGSEPSMNQMLGWMSSAAVWNATNGYSRLNTAADAVGGAINTNWDNRKAQNGVMH